MKTLSPKILRTSISSRIFGGDIIQNNYRSEVVEEIISIALPKGWCHCAYDWASWDFEHQDGFHLEVKQSAAKQTWQAARKSSPRFDIAKRKGFWNGSDWQESIKEKRFANAYVFAWHSIIDESCNHFDVQQWEFFVVDERMLPDTKSIGLNVVRAIVEPCRINSLAESIESIRARVNL